MRMTKPQVASEGAHWSHCLDSRVVGAGVPPVHTAELTMCTMQQGKLSKNQGVVKVKREKGTEGWALQTIRAGLPRELKLAFEILAHF